MSVAGPRLVFLDAATFGDVSLEHFSADWDCTLHPSSSPDEVPDRLTGRDAVVVNKVTLDRNVLASPETRELKLIAVAAPRSGPGAWHTRVQRPPLRHPIGRTVHHGPHP